MLRCTYCGEQPTHDEVRLGWPMRLDNCLVCPKCYGMAACEHCKQPMAVIRGVLACRQCYLARPVATGVHPLR